MRPTDTNQFLIEKNSDLHLYEMQIRFYLRKNSYLHLRKMQICFCIEEKSYISPKLIEWNMVDNYATNIKGNARKILREFAN